MTGPVRHRGRRALSASVDGYAARWIINRIGAEGDDYALRLAAQGHHARAASIANALAELREADRQATAVPGTTATPKPAPPSPSTRTARTGPGLVPVHVAADRLGIGARRVRDLIAAGDLTAHKHGHAWAIDSEDLDRLTAERRTA